MRFFGPKRIRTAISQRRFQFRARREFETQRFISELLARDPKLSAPGRLGPFEHRVFSQNGEDGVIAEIFRRIGTTNQQFVEFGCGNGIENNSLHLLHRDWSGLWIDGDAALVKSITASHTQFINTGSLRLLHSMVTAENIEDLFDANGVPTEPDVLSIDIDGNDYWVWQAIERYRPRVVVAEYNAVWPADSTWVQAYEPFRPWNGTTHMGSSLGALNVLAEKKGYRLVHCDISGTNAFFVRLDEAGDNFAPETDAADYYQPQRLYLGSVVARPRGLGPFETV